MFICCLGKTALVNVDMICLLVVMDMLQWISCIYCCGYVALLVMDILSVLPWNFALQREKSKVNSWYFLFDPPLKFANILNPTRLHKSG